MSDVLPLSLDRRADADQQSYCVSSLIQLADAVVPSQPSSGVPIYLQLMEQVKHAIDTGVLRPGEQLPGHQAAGRGARDQSEHRWRKPTVSWSTRA